jgi:hypothetical protein
VEAVIRRGDAFAAWHHRPADNDPIGLDHIAGEDVAQITLHRRAVITFPTVVVMVMGLPQ